MRERERNSHKTLALSRDPKEKAPMSLRDLAAEKEAADLQIALHMSRMEAQELRGKEKQPCE
jgi:hypothetical protein